MHLDEAKTLFCTYECPFDKGRHTTKRYIECDDCENYIDMCKICPIDKFIQSAKDHGVKIEDTD